MQEQRQVYFAGFAGEEVEGGAITRVEGVGRVKGVGSEPSAKQDENTIITESTRDSGHRRFYVCSLVLFTVLGQWLW